MEKKIFFMIAFFVIIFGSLIGWQLYRYLQPEKTIKIGILHSKTGTFAISGLPLIDALLFAIDEINNNGGLLGRKIKPIIADGKSDPQTFAKEAQQLITQEKVVAIFGCWTSASRKLVKHIVEKYNILLFYPTPYEGLELSSNIIYNGAAPNQQIIPGVMWCLANLGKRFYLIGSDTIYSRAANEIIKNVIEYENGIILAQDYIPLDDKNISPYLDKIIKAKPDVVLNTITGKTNFSFFTEFRKKELGTDTIATMSFNITESELSQFEFKNIQEDYVTLNYFQRIVRDENRIFIDKFKKKYGKEQVISAPLEASYFGFHIWSKAVKKAQTTNTNEVLQALKAIAYNAPEGIIYIDKETQHTWKRVLVGKIRTDKQFTIIWDSRIPIRPLPYPIYKTREEWDKFLTKWYKKWGNKWSAQ